MRIIYISKRKLYMGLFSFFIIIFLMLLLVLRDRAEPVSYIPITNKIVGIDPGHGGVDPGAIGVSGVQEADINLKIGLKLKRLIEQSGGIAVMTRDTDKGLYTERSKSLKEKKTEDLHNRKRIIEDGKCDIFITIHLNSFEQSKYYGAQTFYRKGSQEGMKLSNCIQEELRKVLDENNHRQPQEREDVFLLNELEIPSVLVECGFLSNPREEGLLATDEYQERIAWAIFTGIIKYFEE